MSKLYFFIAFILSGILFNPLHAQIKKGEFINASIGLGFSSPVNQDEHEVTGTGFYAQAEYVYNPLSWVGVRPYAGVIIASDELEEEGVPKYKAKSNAALLGVKIRVAAPIPYVAPFIESGVGMSIGSFETYTNYTDLKKNGVLLHIPFTFGLAIGRNHDYEVKFTYYYHDAVDQFSGAAAIGISFPINENQ